MKPRYYIASILCAVFVVYPLSVGPVMGIDMAMHPKATDTSIDQAAFYRPLWFVCDRVPALDKALNWYDELWIPYRGTIPN